MEYEDLDDELGRIVQKADKIVTLEVIQQDRIDTLTALREEDGRIKIRLQQIDDEIKQLQDAVMEAKQILKEHKVYFELINQYKGDELQEILKEQIPDYNWPDYSKLQDQLYALTKDQPIEELQAQLEDLYNKKDEYNRRRADLRDNSIMILNELDDQIKEYEESL